MIIISKYIFIAILAILCSNVSAQSDYNEKINDEQVSGTFYQFDLGELYLFEDYNISILCPSWLPWGYQIYRENRNSPTGLELVNRGWFWLQEDIIKIEGISASSSGTGHFHLLIASCRDISLVLIGGNAIVESKDCFGLPSTWNMRVIKRTDTRAVPYWIQQGKEYTSKKDYNNAIFCFDYAIKLDPMNSSAMNLKGFALAEKGEFKEAINCFEDAISIEPAFAEAWKNKGVTLGRLNQHRDAIASIYKANEIDPACADAWLLLGDEFYAISDCKNATIAFDEALKLNRAYRNSHKKVISDAWYCWGKALSDKDLYCEATEAFATAFNINKFNIAAREKNVAAEVRCHALQPLANAS